MLYCEIRTVVLSGLLTYFCFDCVYGPVNISFVSLHCQWFVLQHWITDDVSFHCLVRLPNLQL